MLLKATGGLVQHGFCVRRAEVQNSAVVFQLNISNKLKLCAPKPARTQSPKTLLLIKCKITIKSFSPQPPKKAPPNPAKAAK
jgi:hypothetical protein